ncbi:hypothetical protein I3760_15G074800 [Carya illinoinensis]|nr:hypothetical protein I3760_15G074800 [Carya illinoinensis]
MSHLSPELQPGLTQLPLMSFTNFRSFKKVYLPIHPKLLYNYLCTMVLLELEISEVALHFEVEGKVEAEVASQVEADPISYPRVYFNKHMVAHDQPAKFAIKSTLWPSNVDTVGLFLPN